MTQPTASPVLLQVKGMTCANCALGVERYLKNSGQEAVSVNLAAEEARFIPQTDTELAEVIKGIERLGYRVVTGDQKDESPIMPWKRLEWLFAFCLIWTLPLIAHMFVSWHWLHHPWVQFSLALPVYLVGMYHFGRSAFHSLKSGVPNMDVLIAVGATAAFGYSLYGTLLELGPDFLFYETAASIITLVLLGNLMEQRAVRRTTTALKELSSLQVETAKLVNPFSTGHAFQEVPIEEVNQGAILQINEGDRIPLDGEVIEGQGEVNEAAITGESLPRFIEQTDKVVGGTLLVQGNLQIRVTEIGQMTVLARIIDLVKQAQAEKPPIQQLADRISAIFVPVVLGISLLTFLLAWGVFGVSVQSAIIQAVAVLVISCPCAMGLATPTAVVVGLGRATKAGILIRGGRTLESVGKLTKVAFDKTGTLTTGAFRISAIHSEESELTIQRLLLGLEQHSSHPIAQSVQRELATVAAYPLESVNEIKGLGMRGLDAEGNEYQLGSFRLAQGLTEEMNHHLYLLKNGAILAMVDLADELRPEAANVVQQLRELGLEPVMLSGDQQARCEEVAQAVGITEIYAEQLPQDKLRVIEDLASRGEVAMIGDGINDAPALAKAQVGISLGEATDIAQQSAQVVLLGDRLEQLPELIRISRHTVQTIRQNLFWAFFYNALAIPVAAFGYLQPILATAAMAFSDVMVIGNSLRLKVKRLN